jgi:penicillin-binding protein 2
MYEGRKWVIVAIFAITGLLFLIRLFSIQVLDKGYQIAANDNSIKKIIIYPHRGIIYDRHGKVLVTNSPVYDLMVIPSQMKLSDKKKKSFCELMGITLAEFNKNFQKAKNESQNQPTPFIKQLSKQDYARIQDRLIEYSGFYIATRTVRNYPHQSLAHVLGYVGEISERALEKDTTEYYSLGDYVGISGIEAFYEKELRGEKGVRNIFVDAQGREKGAYKGGNFDKKSITGQDLYTSIDFDLQQLGEKLMQNKAGSIVAIEPKSGEILAMISAPYYDPNLLTGREFSKNYGKLTMDEFKPVFNRTISAYYPPGSTFKTVQLLIGKQENVINDHSVFSCNKALVKCHWHPTCDLHRSIQHSCNPYYWNVYRRIIYQNKIHQVNDSTSTSDQDGKLENGYKIWQKYMQEFNIGRKTGVDLVNEKNGNVPPIDLYNKRYGEGRWNFSNIYSLGVGQGEIGLLPIQLANIAAIIANRGYYYTPHVVKGIGKEQKIKSEYDKKHTVSIDRIHFDVLIDGMQDALKAGTVPPMFNVPELEICGKTGTAQNPHGKDHSVFICFAPKKDPKIAIAVYVENAGWGGETSAPIGILMVQKYLQGKISKDKEWLEKMIIDKQLLFPTPPPTPEEDKPQTLPKKDSIIPENRKIVVPVGTRG